ncbi:MFS transporter [Siccirubricoccus deserti]|uniref:MFS transporter n=1 Tax=Siccirubricoccus deserti TaxID=2013562 RepID=A0A9X0UDH5_9PROT|nr:MFS transporter [Siccirubricoccus deserti]MBC4016422.1 MFS transporter [Siccirubricoccus deserti]GGC49138.1 MFS transporter [Siccirubricoccus deserti]
MKGGALWRLLLVGLGTLVVPLDSALNIAFPPITAHFGLALPDIQWLVIGYVLTYGSLMLGIGRLGDIFGHALVFRIGLGCSALAYLLCAGAPGYGWLLGCRVAQGVGAALVIGCGPALVTGLFPEALRGRVLGLYALMFAAGGVLGPSLGGVLVAAWGWPAVFWFRAPIALLALLLLRGLPAPPPAAMREPFDLPGAVLLALAVGSLLLAVNQARYLAEGGLVAPALAAVFLAALLGFLRRSARAARPIIALEHFRRPGFARLNAGNALANLAGFAVLLFVPYYLADIASLPTAVAGLVLAASPSGAMLGAALAGWLLGRVAAWPMVRLGVGLSAAGLALIALWGAGTAPALLVACLLLHGAGQGLVQVGYTDIVTATLPRRDRGVAGSLTMMTRTLGVVSAASLLTLWFDRWQAAALASGAAPAAGFLEGFSAAFALAAVLCGGVLLLLARPPPSQT